jgi:hypothetical protein
MLWNQLQTGYGWASTLMMAFMWVISLWYFISKWKLAGKRSFKRIPRCLEERPSFFNNGTSVMILMLTRSPRF